jgi:segregation and condensation protein A
VIARNEREVGPFVVDIERFHGPLDLLLHLIRQQDIDILDIPIARITRQFLLAVEKIHELDLDSAGEFLEMAATLVRIKAQLLLPRSGEDPEEDPRAELVRRLLEYEQIREISQRLSRTEADQARRFRKGLIPIRPRPSGDETPLETAWEEVFAAALGVVVPDPRDLEHRVSTRTVTMDEKAALILDALEEATRIEFRRLVRPFRERIHGVMTFLAGLELTRSRQVRLRQSHPFHELWVCRPDSETEGPTNGSGG